MRERLLQFMSENDISSTKLADEIGVQKSSISHILSGRNNPSFDFIIKILKTYPTLSAEWMLLGVGEKYKNEQDQIDAVKSLDKSPKVIVQELFSQFTNQPLDNQARQPVMEAIKKEEVAVEQPKEVESKSENKLEMEFSKSFMSANPSMEIDRIIFIYKNNTFKIISPL